MGGHPLSQESLNIGDAGELEVSLHKPPVEEHEAELPPSEPLRGWRWTAQIISPESVHHELYLVGHASSPLDDQSINLSPNVT